MSSKYTRLEAHLQLLRPQLQQNKSPTHDDHHHHHPMTTTGSGCHDIYDPTANKRARTTAFAHHCNHQQRPQFLVANKTSQFLIRTDSKDNTLVRKEARYIVDASMIHQSVRDEFS